jgi:hypothetical protein
MSAPVPDDRAAQANPERFRLFAFVPKGACANGSEEYWARLPAERRYLVPPPDVFKDGGATVATCCVFAYLLHAYGDRLIPVHRMADFKAELSSKVGIAWATADEALGHLLHVGWVENTTGGFKVAWQPGRNWRHDHQRATAEMMRELSARERRRPRRQRPHVKRSTAPTRPEPGGPDPTEGFGTLTYEEYLESDEWQQLRGIALERAGRRCQVCNASGVILDAHHRTYENLGCENIDDVIILCRDCRRLFHEHGKLAR